jgi:hypothetical protein
MSVGLTVLTIVHVAISLIGIFSGIVVVGGLLAGDRLNRWTAVFLISTAATSVTGFFFPVDQFLPYHGVAIISLLVLPVAVFARYRRHLTGRWRLTYVITAILALH